ncbi:glyoxalase/bleomycin resistance/dioxygenase family protein [Marivirga lumbricoides]|uniref:Glyoxalase/bleomycin resistance/dioxygenase family protein n=1 Tax=Marivirga lumbricoides TaxID=1046115 RepID=A0A2T4DU21_9BACT|nr:glyoxalase/bleomycin resistance/dioxygenase family protein [Marivirga lumbricoides]
MKLEHFALNVKEPLAMTQWYVDNLGMTVVRQQEQSPFTTFLADTSGQMMIEIYNNAKAAIPDYAQQHPLIVHLAFVSENPDLDKERLLTAGAVEVSNDKLEDGSHLIMLRDPWGLAIQLCKRGKPMLQ